MNPQQPQMPPGAWHTSAVPALKGEDRPRMLQKGHAQAGAVGPRKLLTAGRAILHEAAWLALRRTAMSERGDSRAAPLTLQQGSTAWSRDRTSRLLVSWLLSQALVLRGRRAALAIQREVYSSFTSATDCSGTHPASLHCCGRTLDV